MTSSTIAQVMNEHRVFPRAIAIFLAYKLYTFHVWFTKDNSVDILQMKEWSIIGYATVIGAYIGFAKFYMESGK